MKRQYKYPDQIDVDDICWKYSIDIMPFDPIYCPDHYEDGLKSFSTCNDLDRRGMIFLRSSLDRIERKEILAEEFCHVYIDTSNQLNCDSMQLIKSEKRAKRMAAYLLMPYFFLLDVMNLAYEQDLLVSEISDHFLVTEEFAHYRLELLLNHRVDHITNMNGKLGTLEHLIEGGYNNGIIS